MTNFEIRDKLEAAFNKVLADYNLRNILGTIDVHSKEIVFTLLDEDQKKLEHIKNNPIIIQDIYKTVFNAPYVERAYMKNKKGLPYQFYAVVK